ncbi:SDR family NAD(P)-dependent oxidoreductase [Rhodococcus wratislaviensis]|uniref:SDR family NAD(P)-dependent oxidoreductase n=1 Tax=Rhodococcus wratislaviensis TaxID=44752 RepID=UPI003646B4F1
MSDMRFDGRVAIVTGAGGNPGLGREYALLLASRGAKVLVNDLGVGPDGRGAVTDYGPEAVVAEIVAAGGEALPNFDTVATPDGAQRIVDQAMSTWGRVDIVINNAGIAPFALFDELSPEQIERVIAVHLFGHMWMSRSVWPIMKQQGYGRLISVSSKVAVMGMPLQSAYAAAKSGIVGFTRVLAAEGIPFGIKANVLLPAADTLAWQTMLEPAFSEQAQANGVVPSAVAPVAAYLAHEDCDFSGKLIETQAGAVKEIFYSTTVGIAADPHLTLESLASHICDVINRDGSDAFSDPTGKVSPNLVPQPRRSSLIRTDHSDAIT